MNGAKAMEDGPLRLETVILDLSDVRIDDLPRLDNTALQEALKHLIEQDDDMPGTFLGFQSTI
jgi:hypothetical protein